MNFAEITSGIPRQNEGYAVLFCLSDNEPMKKRKRPVEAHPLPSGEGGSYLLASTFPGGVGAAVQGLAPA